MQSDPHGIPYTAYAAATAASTVLAAALGALFVPDLALLCAAAGLGLGLVSSLALDSRRSLVDAAIAVGGLLTVTVLLGLFAPGSPAEALDVSLVAVATEVGWFATFLALLA